ncbi:FAD-dependent oxidoreductase [Massilia horti]|uniref:FAD-dependent monooxygenase n=1 Tax=Massilia horti TaxID=2562153 RepID=A0A4Y9SZN8_9BURK|nr:NAD(P)/FAD-dependent oxidoreductase [Massilia horti]TFW30704.1 FAD-dependent monooxygenase [Massilia horti]
MASGRPEIGIVGAGTAGLATAIAFARSGHAVSVFEKHPCLAPLGAGLLIQPQGVAALDALGVGTAFRSASVPVTRLLGTCHRDWTLVDISYDGTEARGVSRGALSQLLLEAALAAGVQVRYDSAVEAIVPQATRPLLQTQEGEQRFDLIVIADGAASRLPAQVGLAVKSSVYEWGALWAMFDVEHWPDEALLEQRYRTTRQMYGLMPTARVDGKLRLSMFWSLRCDQYDAWKNRLISDWKEELLGLWPQSAPVVDQIDSHDQFAFATYRHARAKRLAGGPVCVVGDAAHAMSPQLGLGATLAVQDALVLAREVARHGVLAGAASYSRRRLWAVRGYQSLSKALTPCFQADGTGLWRDLLFAAGLKVPGVRRLMYRSIAAPAAKNRRYVGSIGAANTE